MKVRWKLVAILIVPLCALVTLAWVGISQRRTVANEAGRVKSIVDLAQSTTGVMHELETEWVVSAMYVSSNGAQGSTELTAARARADTALTGLESRLSAFNPNAFGPGVAEAVTGVTNAINDIDSARGDVDALNERGKLGVSGLQTPLNAMEGVVSQVASQETEPSVAINLAAFATFAQAKLFEAQRLTTLATFSGSGKATPEQVSDLRNVAAQESYQANAFLALAPETFKDSYRTNITGPAFDAVRQAESAALAVQTEPVALDPLARVSLSDLTAVSDAHRTVEQAMETEIGGAARKRANDADRAVQAYMLVALATLAFCIVAASVVGRSITRPLRRLATAARSVANVQLPRLVDTIRNPAAGDELPELPPLATGSARDEIGELAESFDAIQRTAVKVAHDQAELLRKGIGDLFVNLARRNQSLIDRQISFLDELEANEADPDTLDNLFKLDHLATRMRRNAESLLVLAGVESQRRWGKPVPVADVVRAAVAEVEDYARIHISSLDDRLLQGNAAADVAHLLAELFDNSTQFSPPATHVEVRGRADGDGYVVTVTDLGIGMGTEQLGEANETVQRPPVTGLGLSRSLGFTVVGRLAARYRIHVELTANPVGGVTATIRVPAAVLTTGTDQLAPPPPAQAPSPQVFDHQAASDFAPPTPVERRTPLPAADPSPAWGRPLDVPPAVWERLVSKSTPAWEKDDAQPQPAPAASLAEALPPTPETLAVTDTADGSVIAGPGDFTGAGLPRRPSGPTGSHAGVAPLPGGLVDSTDRPAAGLPLPKRVRGTALGETPVTPANGDAAETSSRASSRTPEQIRDLLSSYRGGLNRGREKSVEEDQK
ncbi:MAG: nitrate- and nitrite sensing domain-containing protein [Acidimicrobiales bacterium]